MHLHVQSSVKAGHHSIRSLNWAPQPKSGGDTGWLAVNNSIGTAGITRTSLRTNIPKSYNLHTQQHKGEIAHVRWNEVRQSLVTCDEHGSICQWVQNRNNWIVGARFKLNYPFPTANGSRIVDMVWSHKGKILVVCYSDGVLSMLEDEGEDRRSYTLLNPMPNHVFTCIAFNPEDTHLILGTAAGFMIVVDILGNDPIIQEMVHLNRSSSLHSISWSCPKFDLPETRPFWERKAFILGVTLQNGLLFLLKNYDDQLPVMVYTGLTNIFMQWNTNGELLAVIGQQTRYRPNNVLLTEYLDPYLYSNILNIYNKVGHKMVTTCLKRECYLVEFEAAKCLHWAHQDTCLFVAAGTHVYTVKVIKSASKIEVPTLQHISCSRVCSMIKQNKHTGNLVLPPAIQSQIGYMLKSIINHPIPDCEYKGQDFLYRPLKKYQQVHCTLKKRNDSLFTLYLEFLGNLIPLLGAKQLNTLNTEFVIFDARRDPSFSGNLPQKSDEHTGSPFTQRPSRRNNLFQSRWRNMKVQDTSDNPPQPECLTLSPSNVLATVMANIWKTKFKIKHNGLSESSELSARVSYKTSVLHMAPRKINIELSHLNRKKAINDKCVQSLVFCDECNISKKVLIVEICGKSVKVKFSPKTIPLAFCFDCRENVTVDFQCYLWKVLCLKSNNDGINDYLHDWTWIIQANKITRGKLRSKFIERISMYNMHNKVHFSEKMHLLVSHITGESENKLTLTEEALDVDMFYKKMQIYKKVKIYCSHQEDYRKLWDHTISGRLQCNYFKSRLSQYTRACEFDRKWEDFSRYIALMIECKNDTEKISEALDNQKTPEIFQLYNKAPLWNKTLNIYQLDCGGRVTIESEKNCQFEYNGEQALQFGRIGTNMFTLDFKYPFTPIDAFAVALTSLTHGMK